jgi:hypothetical protein
MNPDFGGHYIWCHPHMINTINIIGNHIYTLPSTPPPPGATHLLLFYRLRFCELSTDAPPSGPLFGYRGTTAVRYAD